MAPHRPTALLLWEADEPDHVEDVAGHLETKLAALLAHRSQYRSTMGIDDPDAPDQVAAFRRRVVRRASEQGARAGVAYGERFRALLDL